jgi:nudix motif 8
MSSNALLPIELPVRFDDATRAAIRDRLAQLARRRLPHSDDGVSSRASVLVPLCHAFGVPSVLFTKRTETVGTHKGQVSFPGGRHDVGDVDEVACALRELDEEVGLPAAHVDVLGLSHELIAITGVRVTPVVAYVGELGDLSSLRLSHREIDVAFTLPIARLLQPPDRERMQLGIRVAPVFNAGPFPVWGLTALILDEVLRDALGLPLLPLT